MGIINLFFSLHILCLTQGKKIKNLIKEKFFNKKANVKTNLYCIIRIRLEKNA